MTASKTKATDKATAKRAPPTEFSPELGEKICAAIAAGASVRVVSRMPGMPNKATIFRWLAMADQAPAEGEEGEGSKQRPFDAFRQMYVQARKFRADARVESIDEDIQALRRGKLDPQAARIIIDAKKWLAGKENQGRYGDAMTLRGDKSAPVQVEQRTTVVELSEAELHALAAKGLANGAG